MDKEGEVKNTFSIESSMETAIGDKSIIDDLFGTGGSTGNPDDLQPIVTEVDDDNDPTQQTGKKPKDEPKPKEGEEESPPAKNIIADFLGDENEPPEGEEKPTGKEKSKEGEGGGESGNQFGALSKDLYKLGVFTADEGEEDNPKEISTPEEFLEKFNNEKRKGAIEVLNNFIGRFGEDYQNAFNAIFVNGVDPKEYFGIYNNIVSFAELDMTQESNQITVVRQALVDQGFEPEDITTEIERLKNYGDLESASTRYHKVLVKKEAQKLQKKEEEAEEKLQRDTAIRNQYIQNVTKVLQDKLKTKEFDGIPINPKMAQELQDFLLVDKWKTPQGETLTDFDRAILDLKKPENHALKVKIALLLKVMEKDPTLSTIQRTKDSSQSNSLFTELSGKTTKRNPTATQTSGSWGNL